MGHLFKKPRLILKLAGRDTISFAAFMAAFISSYKGLLCFMRNMRQRSDWINPFCAGTVAGLSIFLDRNFTRRVMIALYLSTRTFHFMCRWLWRHYIYRLFGESHAINPTQSKPNFESDCVKYPALPAQPVPRASFSLRTRWPLKLVVPTETKTSGEIYGAKSPASADVDDVRHSHHPIRKSFRQLFGTIIMMLSSSQILYSYVCDPESLAVTEFDLETLFIFFNYSWRDSNT